MVIFSDLSHDKHINEALESKRQEPKIISQGICPTFSRLKFPLLPKLKWNIAPFVSSTRAWFLTYCTLMILLSVIWKSKERFWFNWFFQLLYILLYSAFMCHLWRCWTSKLWICRLYELSVLVSLLEWCF